MDLAELVAMYSEAWAADEAERRRLLDVAWHEDGVYSDPVGRAAGERHSSPTSPGSKSSSPATASS